MNKIPFILHLCAGFLIVFISIYGFVLIRSRPALPPASEIFPGLPPEMSLKTILQRENMKLRLEGTEIAHEKDVEFLLGYRTVGEKVSLSLIEDGRSEEKTVPLIPFYSHAPYPLIYLFIGLFGVILGAVVFFTRSEDKRARIFYWTSLAFAAPIIISGGYHCMRKEWMTLLPGILFYILYPLTPVLLFHFLLFFSKSGVKTLKKVIYVPALLFAAGLGTLFLYSRLAVSLSAYRIYQSVFYVFRVYVVIFLILAIIRLVISYRKTVLEEESAQIKWIFLGLTLGLTPFLFLYQTPQVLGIAPLISEEFSILFFIFILLGFAFSILKFKLMRVEVVINRSLVYFFLTVFTVCVYIISIEAFRSLFSRFFPVNRNAFSILGAFIAASAFHPARMHIQKAVDKAFFRTSFDHKKSIISFSERAYKMVKREHLFNYFLRKVKDTLSVEHVGMFVYAVSSGRTSILARKENSLDSGDTDSFFRGSGYVFARRGAVRTEENIDYSLGKLIEEKNLEVVIPLFFKSSDLRGIVSLGKKKSAERYSRDDLELLLAVSRELVLNLERIRLQEKIIYEKVERDKLDELNRLKTEFISSVSHEIRTPLCSIQGAADMLQSGQVEKKEKRAELIKLVAAESGYLSRFIHNVLDYGKIEEQVKTYHFEKVDIRSVIEEAMKHFSYRMEAEDFTVKVKMPKNPVNLHVDRDAVRQTLINLIENAVKYSSNMKDITVRLSQKAHQVVIAVMDKGIGISSEEIPRIFEKFYRHAEASRLNPKGVGLGLKIVKHIMEAHEGEVKVESLPGKGSVFYLVFPKP